MVPSLQNIHTSLWNSEMTFFSLTRGKKKKKKKKKAGFVLKVRSMHNRSF